MKLFNRRPTTAPCRRIEKGNLRNVDVDLISLLFDDMKPANMRGAVVKSADGKQGKILGATAKFKSETVGNEGLLYVTVMEPDVVDSQGDTYTSEEVKKAAYHFAKKGLVGKNDVNHNNQPVPEFVIAESYILKTEDKEHFPATKPGAWVAVLKCENLASDLWQKVVKGQFNGVSIAGFAEDAAPATNNSALVEELKAQMESIRKALGNNPNPDTNKVLDTMQARINELEKADESSATQELIKSFTNEIKELNVSITKAISKSLKGEPKEGGGDTEVMIDGAKVVVKSTHREIYKGIADVDSGKAMNILTPNTTSLFIDEVIGSQPGDTLSDITVVPLIKDEKIDSGLIADLVFTNSLDEAAAAQAVSTRDITCTTGILNAEFTLGRDVVEFYKDKYGEEAFGAYVEQHIAKKAEKAIRLLLFRGDRDSDTPALAGLNGIIKQATTASAVTTIDEETNVNWDEKFEAALLAFSDAMLEDQENFKFYVSHKDLVRIRAELARRETNAGDRFLLEGGNVSFAGIPVKPRLMPDNYIIGGLPKFIILGYRTDAELKVEHHGSDWKYHWYIRVRPGITYVDGFVKVFLIA